MELVERKPPLVALISAAVAGITCLVAVADEAPPIDKQAQVIVDKMGGWFASSIPKRIATITDAERQILIQYYRKRLSEAKNDQFEASSYRSTLLNLGDPAILAQEVKIVLEVDILSPLFQKAFDNVLHADRPESVAMLAPAILVDEPFVMRRIGEEQGALPPRSYGLALGLLEIVAGSPAFTDEVRRWADENSKVGLQKSLPIIRRWWNQNEHLFKDKNYKGVRPGEDLRASELVATDAIQTRKRKYRDDLIAKGKSPADSANWEEWRTVIYPSLTSSSTPGANDIRIAALKADILSKDPQASREAVKVAASEGLTDVMIVGMYNIYLFQEWILAFRRMAPRKRCEIAVKAFLCDNFWEYLRLDGNRGYQLFVYQKEMLISVSKQLRHATYFTDLMSQRQRYLMAAWISQEVLKVPLDVPTLTISAPPSQ